MFVYSRQKVSSFFTPEFGAARYSTILKISVILGHFVLCREKLMYWTFIHSFLPVFKGQKYKELTKIHWKLLLFSCLTGFCSHFHIFYPFGLKFYMEKTNAHTIFPILMPNNQKCNKYFWLRRWGAELVSWAGGLASAAWAEIFITFLEVEHRNRKQEGFL